MCMTQKCTALVMWALQWILLPCALINIPGVFLNKDGVKGLQAELKDCSYDGRDSFNLLSMSKLLHKQGWKITCGDESLIWIENRKGGVINFDFAMPTEKGTICACKFIHASEITASSTECRIEMNINMAHCSLGHRNEDYIRKTARELGWC